jgi:hypothetical protein
MPAFIRLAPPCANASGFRFQTFIKSKEKPDLVIAPVKYFSDL